MRLSKEGKSDGVARVVATVEAADELSVSAAGNRVAYPRMRVGSDLWLLARKGPERLTNTAVRKLGGAVSPDGRFAAFGVREGASSSIYSVDLSTKAVRKITSAEFPYTDVAWSPDGQRIAFVAQHQNKLKIWTAKVSDGTARPFPASETSQGGFELTWSPAPFIVYQRPGNRNFHIIDPETGKERPLLRKESGMVFRPRSSPDGNGVAVMRRRPRGSGVYRIQLDPYQEQEFSPVPRFPIGWSDDGATLFAYKLRQPLIVALGGPGVDDRLQRNIPSVGTALNIHRVPKSQSFVANVVNTNGDIWVIDLDAQ